LAEGMAAKRLRKPNRLKADQRMAESPEIES
jgi:hypothetical protein